MSNLRNTLGDFLQEARVLIGNSQTLPGIADTLAEFGYTKERFAEGQSLLQTTEALVLKQKKEYGEQYEATAAAQAAWTAADTAYGKTVKIARLVFADDVQATTALKLSGSRKATLAGWMDQAVFFYGNLTAQPRLVAALGKFGYTPAKLAAEKALVDALQLKVQAQAKETGEAQQATVERDVSIRALDSWIGELRTVLKVALADDPQKLESVGITVGVTGRPKKKADPAAAVKV
jgi:hypothetical protein